MSHISDSAQHVVDSFNNLQEPADRQAALDEMRAANANLTPSSNKDKLILW
jgi:hypothetical protein